ncbi:zinc finger E-box-binding homeobox 1-like [Actinia tenebrosa]|uniref:Zinc finger E-box-binding homeobox 1-like n=1 Tax=Actinia tenebrosa TaxID=6105 RepID=A0A6P8IQ77_ACTTE|nr:zinc finger E-box-binding homeobox 1-like [Actinia tenebrosa]
MEAKQMNDDWLGLECKSGLILFYYNKRTGEHKWPCCSKCPEKGLHSDETTSSVGSLHQDKATSVSVGTQTEDSGCGNGCTSIYINKNMNSKECLELGHSDVENNPNSLDEKTRESSCFLDKIPLEMDVIVDEGLDHSIYGEQTIAAEKEAGHERKRVKQEEIQNMEEFIDAENNNEAIHTDKFDDNLSKSERQEMSTITEKSGENKRNADQVYTVNSSQSFMNLQNVSKIIIENPHHETGEDSSSPRRQILEIKVPDASPLLTDSRNITGSPTRQVSKPDSSRHFSVDTRIPASQLCVSTEIQRNRSFIERGALSEKQVTRSTIPRDNSPVEISLDVTRINTGIPRDHSPVESSLAESSVNTGIRKEQALSGITTGIPHSSQPITYTHVIHVDTAITSGNLNSNLSSHESEAPTGYRMIAYPEIEEVCLPECTTVFKEQATTSDHSRTSPPTNAVESGQKVQTKPRFLESPNRPCGCPLCDTVFSSTKTFFEHLFNHCDWKTKECAICKKTFANKYGLQRHLQSHASYRPHECIRCGKLFLRSHHLKAHMLTHNNGKAANVYMAFV